LLGVVIAGGSIVVALVLAATAPGARAQTISQFARAAAGCRTTIDVATSGTYIVVSEVRGALVDVDGSCPASAGRFDLGGSTAPAVAVVVRAADGTEVEVTPSQGGSYDTGTYAGAVAATLELSPGRYEVEVTSSSRAVVAIGADPDATVRTQRTAAAVVAAAGVASGAVVVATGRRRRR
jgi:hypothetical protein